MSNASQKQLTDCSLSSSFLLTFTHRQALSILRNVKYKRKIPAKINRYRYADDVLMSSVDLGIDIVMY